MKCSECEQSLKDTDLECVACGTPTTRTRVERAEEILMPYTDLDGETETALVDCLADLMHWARTNNIDWTNAERVATNHHFEESRLETPGPLLPSRCGGEG